MSFAQGLPRPDYLAPRFLSEARVGKVRACFLRALFLSLGTALALPMAVGLKVDAGSFLTPLTSVACFAPAWFYAGWRGMERTQAAVELLVLSLLLTLPVLVFSYSAMHLGLPLADARLAVWDAALGFHALHLLTWLDHHPAMASLLLLSYRTFFPQMLLLPVLLCACRQFERAYAMSLGFLLIGIIGTSIAIFFPAVGVYAHHGVPPEAFANIDRPFSHFHIQLEHVRLDPDFILDAGEAQGIIAFPSGHAAAAVLCAWAAWGLRRLRWFFLALNLCMFVSALPQGAHYLVDLLAGAALAAVTVGIVSTFPHRPLRRAPCFSPAESLAG